MIFDDEFVFCNVNYVDGYSHLHISGNIKNPMMYDRMLLIAPNPIDRMTNYSGSGLPFPCADIAFENTPSKLLVSSTGAFTAHFAYPNSFYMPNGKDKVLSSIFFSLTDKNNKTVHLRYELDDLNPLRTLVNRGSRTGPEFYGAKDYLLPIATAENVMREYARIKVEHDVA